jgi:hypothetical protein
MNENKTERIAVPDETRGIGTDLAVGVASGVVGGVAGAVTQQVIGSVTPKKPKK